ncbi:MAG: hypothetical protein ACXAEU_20425 [Candidatus Hodarchaeales archaeon]|jgi:hypothetical protein
MIEDYIQQYLSQLERISLPYFLQKRLEEKYESKEKRLQDYIKSKIADYNKKIAFFMNIPLVRQAITRKKGKNWQTADIITPRKPGSDFKTVARESAVFFQQGLEMLKTSLSMHENTSPLVEYYSNTC